MRLTIKAIDIRRGIRGRSKWCPIAWALYRAVPKMRAEVSPWTAVLREMPHGIYLTANLSRKAQKFVEDFDGGKRVAPFTTLLTFNGKVLR